MMDEKDSMLELIPESQMSARQKAFRVESYTGADRYLPMYKLLLEPSHLEDINWEFYGELSIWRENGTVISTSTLNLNHQFVTFYIKRAGRKTLNCSIFGHTDDAVAETVTFFWSLKQSESTASLLTIDEYTTFDVAAISAQQLVRILDANPTRLYEFHAGTWTAEQSEVLASTNYFLNLKVINDFAFQDSGTAFVDALQRRQDSFGWLHMSFYQNAMSFSRFNWQRHLTLENRFEMLVIDEMLLETEVLLLPFFMRVKALVYNADGDPGISEL
jgi:hypothetical protein